MFLSINDYICFSVLPPYISQNKLGCDMQIDTRLQYEMALTKLNLSVYMFSYIISFIC